MKLGVCYYPEHWPESIWPEDAQRMVDMGISVVRIAEFAWSRIEPEPGRFDWEWLDRAINTLHGAGLSLVMCTPTATPPKWLVDGDPDMLAVDAQGQVRQFGSRRHYCFSSASYRLQCARITTAMGKRYGGHPGVIAWQTDNEYGCHDTVLSYSRSARIGFRAWLKTRYTTIDALNQAWGTVFWSQEYRNFDEVDAPVSTVTEAHPAHRLDYRRFASDEVVAFNRIQVDLLRQLAPGRDVVHNFMGFFTEFDHHDVSRDLDVATWDSYPLGFTQNFFLTAQEKFLYARTGHPDIPSFHHDLYRGMCQGKNKGRWWVMEQQPGPVNWAQWNPAPHDGMVRLWTWQAFAHGAEVVSYFRWRQAPFAQEQMHAGLNRPDRTVDQGGLEAAQVFSELKQLADQSTAFAAKLKPGAPQFPVESSSIAIIFDYSSLWMAQIQPQGADFNALELTFRVYSALRQLGQDVDILPSEADLTGYRLVVLPAHMRDDAALAERLVQCGAQVVLGPRSGSKTQALAIPQTLAPGAFAAMAGVRVMRVESLPPGLNDAVSWSQGTFSPTEQSADSPHNQESGNQASDPLAKALNPRSPPMDVTRWREDLACTDAVAMAWFANGRPAVTRCQQVWYAAGWFNAAGWLQLLSAALVTAELPMKLLPTDLRLTRLGDLLFVQNFSSSTVAFSPSTSAHCLLGAPELPPLTVSIWRVNPCA